MHLFIKLAWKIKQPWTNEGNNWMQDDLIVVLYYYDHKLIRLHKYQSWWNRKGILNRFIVQTTILNDGYDIWMMIYHCKVLVRQFVVDSSLKEITFLVCFTNLPVLKDYYFKTVSKLSKTLTELLFFTRLDGLVISCNKYMITT